MKNTVSFPLVTYEETWRSRRKIRAEVLARHMPPWAAVPGYGEFANTNSLTLREIQFLAKEDVVDEGVLGLFFTNAPTPNQPSDLVIEAKGAVPSNALSQRFRAETRLESDIRALALRPETFPGAKSIEVSARDQDGGTQILLFARDIPEDWPTPYILKRPVLLRKGVVLSVTAHYANATASPQPGGVRLTLSRY